MNKQEAKQMVVQGGQVMGEVALLVAIAATASADIAVRTEAVTPDQLLILWCVIGGMVGSFCSLQFFQVKTRWEASMQLGVNLGLSSMVSPLAVDLLSQWTGYPVGLRLSLPVSCLLGICGQQAVALLIPFARKWLSGKASAVVGEH